LAGPPLMSASSLRGPPRKSFRAPAQGGRRLTEGFIVMKMNTQLPKAVTEELPPTDLHQQRVSCSQRSEGGTSMKASLVVVTPGKWGGKEIPITVAQFIIGRDLNCNLRPSSPLISKRHCAILIRGMQVFLRDFASTNGTFVNNQKIEDERELENADRLTVGPLLFEVRLETSTPVNRPTPMPPTKARKSADDEDAAAAVLLSLQEGDDPGAGEPQGDQTLPIGSTLLGIIPLPPEAQSEKEKTDDKKRARTASGNTATAAQAILDKYLRRPRT
jgi:pSer/pThr/pTyr-binding forkhead associated (FHA) protein